MESLSHELIHVTYVLLVDSLGPEYGEGLILNLETTWEESEPRTPLICILSIGSDPFGQIAALAKAKEIRESRTYPTEHHIFLTQLFN